MRLQTKRALDFYLGRPLLSTLQAAAWVLGSLLRRDHQVGPVRTILIVKYQGLGSLVIAKPAIAALRRHYPDAKILFWGTSAMAPLAREMPEFDEVLVLNDRSLLAAATSMVRTVVGLWRERIDWAFDLEAYSRLSSVLVTLSLARNRTGFALEQLRSRRVHTHLVYFNRYLHIGEAYGRLFGQLLPLDQAIDTSDFGGWRFDTAPLPSLPQRYFLFNIHAGDLALERRWPRESFRQLIVALLALRPDAVAVLIGHGPTEVAYTAPLAEGPRIVDLSGRLSLTETYRAIANAELVVTNDTAPLHFALSAHSRVVGLFGPTRAETYLTPGRAEVAGAQIHLYCSPCVHHWEPSPCGGNNQCMKRLTPALVLAQCCALLGLPVPEPAGESRSTGLEADLSYYPGLVYLRPGPQGQS
ncbi:MAG: glycosyltransferase family 9 protein [Gemmatimonadota bacterium]|nr:glycosyltransferase family 9 protein [Gemmatimonadota bacterium]